ncbi:hypothetical protein FOVSG1_008049 [Fusarium oxysporum f. sp. vasinfectum]
MQTDLYKTRLFQWDHSLKVTPANGDHPPFTCSTKPEDYGRFIGHVEPRHSSAICQRTRNLTNSWRLQQDSSRNSKRLELSNDKGNPVIARLREELVKSTEREDLESLAQKVSEEHKHELREARLVEVASCVGFILSCSCY